MTTVLSLAVPIPGLKSWAANMTAKEAVDNWEELSGLSITDRYERLRRAHESSFNRAGLRGTAIHKAAEGMVRGDEVSVPDEMVGPVRAIASSSMTGACTTSPPRSPSRTRLEVGRTG